MDRPQLLDAWRTLGVQLRAAEVWEDGYRKSAKTFKALLEAEGSFQVDVAEHFHELATRRLSSLIDWAWTVPRLKADAVQPQDSDAAREEMQVLVTVVIDHVVEIMTIGSEAGMSIYGTPADPVDLQATIMKAAHDNTAELVKGVTKTTRDLIRKSVQLSIDAGENVDGMIARLTDIIDNPVRAELIARTESVNAYQAGQHAFAVQTGATTKTWEAKQVGACKICAPMDNVTIGINELFTLPNGKQVTFPTAHVKCRCGTLYGYPN